MANLKSDFRAIARANLQSLDKEKERFRDKKINLLLKKIIENEFDSGANQRNFWANRANLRANLATNRVNLKKIRTIRHPKRVNPKANPKKIRKIRHPKIPKTPKNILLYAPLDLEVNIFPLIFHLKKQKNIKIFLPFVFQNGKFANQRFKIVPFRLPLAKNKFNIYESKNSNFMNFDKIDLAIVPILGVDCAFRRIGFGKGMFDRFYEGLKRKPKTIFVSRILHFSNAKISDFYDITGDFLVAARGNKYDFHSDWIKRSDYCRPFIWHSKAILHQRAQSLHRTSANQS